MRRRILTLCALFLVAGYTGVYLGCYKYGDMMSYSYTSLSLTRNKCITTCFSKVIWTSLAFICVRVTSFVFSFQRVQPPSAYVKRHTGNINGYGDWQTMRSYSEHTLKWPFTVDRGFRIKKLVCVSTRYKCVSVKLFIRFIQPLCSSKLCWQRESNKQFRCSSYLIYFFHFFCSIWKIFISFARK